jgi:hypothetical protein
MLLKAAAKRAEDRTGTPWAGEEEGVVGLRKASSARQAAGADDPVFVRAYSH